MLRSKPSGDQKEELAGQRSRPSTGSVAGGKMALVTFQKRPVEHSRRWGECGLR